ncbi:hypothetical protein NA57DRAFT_46756 [Rhizodiscina lignyota]|uniref:Sequence orphan n=1 Tax=Rhizodiscina lignyota TaxID=1504668 RepID=A0A9P4I7A9_9PEZI|nr:hypothetical protein NA57DRAFT_46756 [Rhizodiscina lignyota]
MGESGGAAEARECAGADRGRAVKPPRVASPVSIDVDGWRSAKLVNGAERAWNTRNLGWRVGADAAAALSAGALVAPIITIIDRGIMENASGRNTLGASIKASLGRLLFQPHRFVFSKPFALVIALYSGTYFTANSVDTVSSTLRNQPSDKVTAGVAKFTAPCTTNLVLCLYKDSKYTQMFGVRTSVPRPVPLATYGLYTIRDCLTIFASFNLPALIAPRLPMDAIPLIERNISSMSAAQVLAPAGIQLFSTPLHLLGLDLYNRTHVTWAERWSKVKSEWGMSTFARMGRIIPAFGFGGVVNAAVRRKLINAVD